jgi:hypothetical protein
LQTADASTSVPSAPPLPMNAIWRTIRGYIWWSYERGTIHYDIMVTLILLFVLLSPYWINFNDKPVERNPHPTGLVVVPDKQGGFIYQIDASAVTARDDAAIRNQLRQIIEPISGAVDITKYEAVKDVKGHVQSYRVWAEKE